ELALIAGILTAFLLTITLDLAQKTQSKKRQVELINKQLEKQIIERRKFIEEISQSQQQYESLVNWIEGIVWEADGETFQFTFVSQKAERLLGYPLEKWIEEPNFWINHIHPEDREWAVKFCVINLQQKRDYEFEYRMITNDGRVVWLRDLVNVVIEDTKLVKRRGVMIDITDHQQAKIALQESEERWQLALRGNNDGIWDWNIKTNEVFFSNRWKEMLGYPENEISHHLSEWEKRVHPDDLMQVKELIQAHFAKATPFYISEHRVICKDGSYKWILDRGQALWDENGHPIRMTGSHTDITQRKQMEEALHQANEELKGWVNQLEQRNQEIIRLGELSDILQACLTVEEAYKVIAQMLRPLFPNMSGGIFITSASRKLVEAVAVWEQEAEISQTREVKRIDYSVNYKQISLSDSFPSQQLFPPHECWSLRRGRLHFTTSKNRGLICKHIHSRPAESLCVPMMAQGEALGILYLTAKQRGQITETKQILAVTVAEHIALALANLRLQETLQHQSIRDPLTGLFNRRYLEESLERELHRAARIKQTLGVMMLDVDHFKKFNDTFGHDACDAVLRELGIFLRKNTRGSDFACRYGGEELTLIMPEACLVDIKERAEILLQGVKCLNLQHQGQHLGIISFSIGVAVYPEHGITGKELIQAADTALYVAKKEGRDRVSISH
ncbi:MAG: diguanylate cyclase, partial [Phormidium sp.]